MKLRYKIDVLAELKKRGYTTYKLQKSNILGNSTIQKIRQGEIIAHQNIAILCELLECQPGEILEAVPDEAES